MPSLPHEALLELFRRRPTLAGEILGLAPLSTMPSLGRVDVVDSNLTSTAPVERAADLVLLFSEAPDSGPERAVVVEVQLQVDPDKRRSWWWYLVATYTRHQCETLLVVVTPYANVARWAARPIELGHPGAVLTPLVIGPKDVPVVRDLAEAAGSPELVVLSAIVHGQTDAADDVARAAFAALRPLDDERARIYTDLVIVSLRASARAILEDLMGNGTYEYQSDFAKKYVAQGRAEGVAQGKAEGEAKGVAQGKALSVLGVLEARGLAVSEEVRARVLACTDPATLDRWLARAVTAGGAAEVVAE